MVDRKALDARLEEQKRLGHPNFKNQIIEALVEEFGVESEEAKRAVFHSEIESRIDEDMIWAQHMGPDFWAETIMEQKRG